MPKPTFFITPNLDVETVKKFREKHPDAPLVLYINTSANAKMYADYIVTNASALKLISRLDRDKILFGPDKNLCSYVVKRTGKKIVIVPSNGYCYMHEQLINRYNVEKAKGEHPDAELLVHPEISAQA